MIENLSGISVNESFADDHQLEIKIKQTSDEINGSKVLSWDPLQADPFISANS